MNADLRFFLRIGALGLLLPVAAQADDLLAVFQRARENDTAFLAARSAFEASAERPVQARAALLPAVQLAGGSGAQRGAAGFADAAPVHRKARTWNWNLQLTQAVWRPGAWADLQRAQAQQQAAHEEWRLAQQDLMLRATQAYLDVLVAEEGVRAAAAYLTAVEQQLTLATRHFDVGSGAITDVDEARARRDAAQAQAVVARNEREVRLAELERLLGAAPGPLQPLSRDATLPTVPVEGAEHWLRAARIGHPAVRLREAALEAARSEVERQRAAHLPSVDVTAGYGRNDASGSVASPADIASRVRSTQVGVALTVPLYSGGGVQSRVREALAQQSQAEQALEGARRQAVAQARQAWAGWVNGQAQTQALASAVRSAEAALTSNRIGYRIGTRINTDVLNAEQQLHAAQRDHQRARVDLLMHGLRLKASAGELSESDLVSLNALLAPLHP